MVVCSVHIFTDSLQQLLSSTLHVFAVVLHKDKPGLNPFVPGTKKVPFLRGFIISRQGTKERKGERGKEMKGERGKERKREVGGRENMIRAVNNVFPTLSSQSWWFLLYMWLLSHHSPVLFTSGAV